MPLDKTLRFQRLNVLVFLVINRKGTRRGKRTSVADKRIYCHGECYINISRAGITPPL